jgi:hypothetical protein
MLVGMVRLQRFSNSLLITTFATSDMQFGIDIIDSYEPYSDKDEITRKGPSRVFVQQPQKFIQFVGKD